MSCPTPTSVLALVRAMLHTSPRREEVQCESTTGTQLNWTDLYEAKLRGANLRGANLRGADLYDANLGNANLLFANLRHAYLRYAHLSGANLIGANLSHKGGNWSGWSGANLRAANLGHAWLRGANLRRARHVTDEQLEKAETLAGATMPDGQTLKGGLLGDEAPNGPTFEEWLKDKKAQGKDEKNK
jgi:uncharacterized protein YjbI with pentapeptide repeats